MRKKWWLYIICFSFVLSACKTDDEGNIIICDSDTIISSSQYNNAVSDIFDVDEFQVSGDCLEVSIGASGCDGETWILELIDSGSILESNPPQRNLRLVLSNNEACLAFITRVFSFDLQDLQAEGNTLILNITNINNSVTYTY